MFIDASLQYNDLATAQLASHNASLQTGTHHPTRPHTALATSTSRPLDRAGDIRRPATARGRVSERVTSANALDNVLRQNEVCVVIDNDVIY